MLWSRRNRPDMARSKRQMFRRARSTVASKLLSSSSPRKRKSKNEHQQSHLSRPIQTTSFFFRQLEQALEVLESNITRPEIPRSTERTHAHDARLLQHQGLKRVLSERSLSLGVGEAREGERQPETHTRRAGRFMMRTSVSVFQWRSCLKSKVAPNQRSQGKRLREM